MNSKRGSFGFADLSRYRGEIMGIAAVEVVLFHFFPNYYASNNNLLATVGRLYVSLFGAVGVELFLLVSGIGLYYSLNANRDLKTFFKKRFLKVVIPYSIWAAIVIFIDEIICNGGNVLGAIARFTFVSFITGRSGLFWYIFAAIVTYLLAPLVYKGIAGKKPLISMLLWVAGAVLFSIAVALIFPGVHSDIARALHRFPMFFIGMFMGRLAHEDKPVGIWMYATAICGLLLKIISMINATEGWVRFIPPYYIEGAFSLFLILAIVVFFKYVTWQWLSSLMKLIGSYSLEIYITHEGMIRLFACFGWNYSSISGYLSVIVISVAASVALKYVSNKVANKVNPPMKIINA